MRCDGELDLSVAAGSASGGQWLCSVVVALAGDGITAAPAIEIEFSGDARVRIPASVSPALAAAVVAALAQR